MGGVWLGDLADVVSDAGLRLRLWDGWQTRGRSSGGYDDVRAVVAHHTASTATPESDCRYMWDGSPDRPVGAVLLDRDGVVTVGAAGATNCQGKGGPWTMSRGTIPLDRGNSYGIAIEAANAGTGEIWPGVQTEAYVTLCAALCDAYGLDPYRDVLSHWEWVEPSCPGRKIDPAGPSPWATGTTKWDMDGFRVDVADCGIEPPTTPPQEDDVTEADIEAIAKRSAQLVWTHLLGNITTGASDEAGDIVRNGAYQAGLAADRAARLLNES